MSHRTQDPDIPPGSKLPGELVTVKCRQCRKWLCRPETMPLMDGDERERRRRAPFAAVAEQDRAGWCYCAWCAVKRREEAEAKADGVYHPVGPRRDTSDRRRSSDRLHLTDDDPWYETAARAMEDAGG